MRISSRLTLLLHSPAFWLCALCAEAAVILILSVIPSVGGGINGGTTAHLLAYATLSCTAGIQQMTKKIPLAIVKGALLAVLFGALIEVVQYFIPFRACEFSDIAINGIASLAGMAGAGILRRTFPAIESSAGGRENEHARPLL
jgi:hypothetical protein